MVTNEVVGEMITPIEIEPKNKKVNGLLWSWVI